MAMPADYAGDELLTNWSKQLHNPIANNTQRDPSSPWKAPSGVYASASDADLLAGRWRDIGGNPDFPTAECPSLYPLPGPTPGCEVLVPLPPEFALHAADLTQVVFTQCHRLCH
eukprot:SAG22_NODE_5104_length_1085_cov_1.198783_1_plen_114_part_00